MTLCGGGCSPAASSFIDVVGALISIEPIETVLTVSVEGSNNFASLFDCIENNQARQDPARTMFCSMAKNADRTASKVKSSTWCVALSWHNDLV